MKALKVSRLTSGGVITNYYGTTCCAHCLYNCGHHRSKNYLTRETAETIFATIPARG